MALDWIFLWRLAVGVGAFVFGAKGVRMRFESKVPTGIAIAAGVLLLLLGIAVLVGAVLAFALMYPGRAV